MEVLKNEVLKNAYEFMEATILAEIILPFLTFHSTTLDNGDMFSVALSMSEKDCSYVYINHITYKYEMTTASRVCEKFCNASVMKALETFNIKIKNVISDCKCGVSEFVIMNEDGKEINRYVRSKSIELLLDELADQSEPFQVQPGNLEHQDISKRYNGRLEDIRKLCTVINFLVKLYGVFLYLWLMKY